MGFGTSGARAAPDPHPAEPHAGAAFAGDTLTREELVDAVLARNPHLEAAEAAWEAARQRVPQVSSLADPELSYGLAPLSIASDDVDFGQSLEARQRLPWPGRLRLRGEAAEARAAVRSEELERLRLELARMADELFYDLYLIDRSQEINDEHLRLVEELKETATHRYASGLAPQQVPLQAEVELTHLVHRAVTLRTDRSVAVARVNALLHRPPSAPLPTPVTVPVGGAAAALEARLSHGEAAVAGAPAHGGHAVHGDTAEDSGAPPGAGADPGAGAPPSAARPGRPALVTVTSRDLAGHGARADAELIAELADRAVAGRPEIAAWDAELRARRVERELAGLERRPDFGVMGTYNSMWRETEHQFMLGVTVSLPIWGERLDAAEAEADAALAEIEAHRRAEADEIRSQVAEAAERLALMAHVVDLYESRLLPAARDQLRAARVGFETGAVAFTALVEAERNLRSVDLGYQQALTDRHRRRAALERALGAGTLDDAAGDDVRVEIRGAASSAAAFADRREDDPPPAADPPHRPDVGTEPEGPSKSHQSHEQDPDSESSDNDLAADAAGGAR